MYGDTDLESKMAAAVGFVGRCRFACSGSILLHTRTFAAQSKAKRALEERKRKDDVFLLNYRTPPSHSFAEAMGALRAYAINGDKETVELQIKIHMGENKASLLFYVIYMYADYRLYRYRCAFQIL